MTVYLDTTRTQGSGIKQKYCNKRLSNRSIQISITPIEAVCNLVHTSDPTSAVSRSKTSAISPNSQSANPSDTLEGPSDASLLSGIPWNYGMLKAKSVSIFPIVQFEVGSCSQLQSH